MNKAELVLALLPKAFEWARSAHPKQPLTSGVWKGDWSAPEKLTPMEKIQLGMSDVISFHNYDQPQEFEKAHSVVGGVSSSDSLHGIYGARQQEHLRGHATGGEEI